MTTTRRWGSLGSVFAVASALAIAMTVLVLPLPRASAAGTTVSMASRMRDCNFAPLTWVPALGTGRGTAQVTVGGGRVTANFVLVTAVPNTYYDVRIIQTPRPSIGCGPGAPGVASGGFFTDDVGAGGLSLVAPIAGRTTGAWLIIERPSEYTQTPAEYYTSDFIVSL